MMMMMMPPDHVPFHLSVWYTQRTPVIPYAG